MAALAAASVAALTLVTPTAVAAVPASCGLVAHRGDHATFTENSIGAARAAAASADYVEVDVRATKDDRLVLMHDRDVRRTTNGSGYVHRRSLAHIRALRLDDGSRVPTLAGFFDAVRSSDVEVLLELKAMGGRATWSRLLHQVRSFGLSRLRVTSFHRSLLDGLARRAPRVPLGLLTGERVPTSTVRPYDAVLVHHAAVTDRWLSAMQFPVFVWTPNRIEDWQHADRVRAVITDQPARFAAARPTLCGAATQS